MDHATSDIARHLVSLGWNGVIYNGCEVSYLCPDPQYRVELTDGWWTLYKCANEDGHLQPERTLDYGDSIDELKEALKFHVPEDIAVVSVEKMERNQHGISK